MQSNKIAIVTGANGGIGIEITKGLLSSGYTVVMACRSLQKANVSKAELLKKMPSSIIDVMELDLSDLASVESFAKEYKSRYQHLDLLINNAGLLFNTPKKNAAGIEMQFATNHLGHFTLTELLIDMMPDSSSSRVVSLGSIAHKNAEIFFEDINCESQQKWDTPYAQSKLACLMFADELNRRLKRANRKIVSLAAHPGGTDSGLFEKMPPLLMSILRVTFVPLFLHSSENAAKPILKAALDSDVKGGEYFGPTGLMEMKGKPGLAKRTKYSRNEDVASKLWALSEKMTNSTFSLQAIDQNTEETS